MPKYVVKTFFKHPVTTVVSDEFTSVQYTMENCKTVPIPELNTNNAQNVGELQCSYSYAAKSSSERTRDKYPNNNGAANKALKNVNPHRPKPSSLLARCCSIFSLETTPNEDVNTLFINTIKYPVKLKLKSSKAANNEPPKMTTMDSLISFE